MLSIIHLVNLIWVFVAFPLFGSLEHVEESRYSAWTRQPGCKTSMVFLSVYWDFCFYIPVIELILTRYVDFDCVTGCLFCNISNFRTVLKIISDRSLVSEWDDLGQISVQVLKNNFCNDMK